MPDHRRQWVAVILSGIFPGAGQLYLRSWGKGAAFLIAGLAATWLLGRMVSVQDLLTGLLPDPGATLGALLALLVVFCWSILDAWRSGADPPA